MEKKELLESIKNKLDSLNEEQLKSTLFHIESFFEKKEKVIYFNRCADSSNHHKSKYKHWAKTVTALDLEKSNGYAFIGDFISVDKEVMIDKDSIIIEYIGCESNKWKLSKVVKNFELEQLAEGTTRNFITFLKECEKYFK